MSKNQAIRRGTLAALVLATTLIAGCSGYNDARGKGDAPVSNRTGDSSPAEVINFPNGFGNVATKCDGHGHRLYMPTHDKTDPNVTVIDDPTCPGGAAK